LVSIIIPTHNRAGFISRAINSCLKQTYSEIEILIVNDNSQDETDKIVLGYKDPRIRYIFHKKNLV
jgi:glycosyltransferase involved in cell wall biosynthesis